MLRTKLKAARTPRPRAITALSIFFVAGATISFIANMSLLLPNSFLEPIWRLNPRAHENLSRLGLWAVLMMSTVSMLCAAATIGLWRGSRWGYLLGNVINVALGTEPRAIVGVPIAAALLAYLIFSKQVREFFSKSKN
jgi:hypothetical protein